MTSEFVTLSLLSGVAALVPFLIVGTKLGVSNERIFYCASLLGAALVYVAFAVIWGDAAWLSIEGFGVGLYAVFALLGWRVSLYYAAIGWMLHPLWDVLLHLNGAGAEIAPTWYVFACVSFDVSLAAFIMFRIQTWRRGVAVDAPIETKGCVWS